jgi:hypothetical protein
LAYVAPKGATHNSEIGATSKKRQSGDGRSQGDLLVGSGHFAPKGAIHKDGPQQPAETS